MYVHTAGLARSEILYSLYEVALRNSIPPKKPYRIYEHLIESALQEAAANNYVFRTVDFGSGLVILNINLSDTNGFDDEDCYGTGYDSWYGFGAARGAIEKLRVKTTRGPDLHSPFVRFSEAASIASTSSVSTKTAHATDMTVPSTPFQMFYSKKTI